MNNPHSSNPDKAMAYASTWLVDEDLQSLNRRIHDGVEDEKLMDRARSYRDRLFAAYPGAAPAPTARVMELGSGVGWIMEAMLERFPVDEIVGLDISANMIARAQERFSDPAASFVLYDGFHMPFADDHFDLVYSVAAMQHIEKHICFLLFEELYRVLAVGGHGVIHLLAVDHIPRSEISYHDECWNHVRDVATHWHHYYSFDELFVLFSDVIGVDGLDIHYQDSSFLVHFSKGTGERYLDPGLPALQLTERLSAAVALRPVSLDPAPPPPPPPPPSLPASTRQLGRALAGAAYRDARRLGAQVRSRLAPKTQEP